MEKTQHFESLKIYSLFWDNRRSCFEVIFSSNVPFSPQNMHSSVRPQISQNIYTGCPVSIVLGSQYYVLYDTNIYFDINLESCVCL